MDGLSDDISALLSRAVDRTGISEVTATIVPSPPHATAYPGDHLFINYSYYPSMLAQSAAKCLAVARSDTIAILCCLVGEQAMRGVESVCVTLVAPAIHATSNVIRQRVYRYSVLSSALRAASDIDSTFLLSNAFFLQDSEVEKIRDLIEREPQTETRLKKELWG